MEKSIVLSKNKYINVFYKTIIYFLFYSIIGFCFETLFAIPTKGVIESRKSFLYGPFCAIYGIGAVLMLLFLNKFKGRKALIFFLGAIIGTVAEYLMSYLCDVILHFKWWDYSGYLFNINGRVCLLFFLIWGGLAILLIEYVNPLFNRFLEKINESKLFKIALNSLIVFLIFDVFITTIALRDFYFKIDSDYNVSKTNGYNVARLNYKNRGISEKKMLKIFPNIIVTNSFNENINVDSLYNNVKTYYIKLFNK